MQSTETEQALLCMALDPYAEPGDYDDPADDCIDAVGRWRPEHDFPALDQGDHCRRCGTRAED